MNTLTIPKTAFWEIWASECIDDYGSEAAWEHSDLGRIKFTEAFLAAVQQQGRQAARYTLEPTPEVLGYLRYSLETNMSKWREWAVGGFGTNSDRTLYLAMSRFAKRFNERFPEA